METINKKIYIYCKFCNKETGFFEREIPLEFNNTWEEMPESKIDYYNVEDSRCTECQEIHGSYVDKTLELLREPVVHANIQESNGKSIDENGLITDN